MPIDRILEPEVMDSQEDAVDYDTMDHSEVNRVFVDDLLLCFPTPQTPTTSASTFSISAPARL